MTGQLASSVAFMFAKIILFIERAVFDKLIFIDRRSRAEAGLGVLKPCATLLVLTVSLKVLQNVERVARHDYEKEEKHYDEHHAEPEHDVVDRLHVNVVASGRVVRVAAVTARVVVHGYCDNVDDEIGADCDQNAEQVECIGRYE